MKPKVPAFSHFDTSERRRYTFSRAEFLEEVVTLDPRVVYRPHPDVIARRMGSEMMLLHLGTNRFYELSRTGARFWELVESGKQRPEIERQLSAEFEVHAAQLAQEIDSLLASLSAEALIHVDDQ